MREKVESDRIILKRYKPEFARLLFEAALESRGGEFSRWMPWCGENYSFDDSESFIKRSIEGWENQTEFIFAIFDRQNDDFLGGVGLNQFNKIHKFYNLGYWVRTSHQNRGIASEATRLLARASFEDLPINRLELLIAIENQASQKAAEKSGATREGILRQRLAIGSRIHDAAMFSFVRKDFNS